MVWYHKGSVVNLFWDENRLWLESGGLNCENSVPKFEQESHPDHWGGPIDPILCGHLVMFIKHGLHQKKSHFRTFAPSTTSAICYYFIKWNSMYWCPTCDLILPYLVFQFSKDATEALLTYWSPYVHYQDHWDGAPLVHVEWCPTASCGMMPHCFMWDCAHYFMWGPWTASCGMVPHCFTWDGASLLHVGLCPLLHVGSLNCFMWDGAPLLHVGSLNCVMWDGAPLLHPCIY